MKRKKLATMLVVAFAISATSVAPVMGAENEDISKYDCVSLELIRFSQRLNSKK